MTTHADDLLKVGRDYQRAAFGGTVSGSPSHADDLLAVMYITFGGPVGGAGSIGLNIAVGGFGGATARLVGAVGLNIAVAGAGGSVLPGPTGIIGINISVQGVGGSIAGGAGLIGINIAVAGDSTQPPPPITAPVAYYDLNVAFSYPQGANLSQVLSYDPINYTLLVTPLIGTVSAWYTRWLSQAVVANIIAAPDKIVYINTALQFPPVTPVFIN